MSDLETTNVNKTDTISHTLINIIPDATTDIIPDDSSDREFMEQYIEQNESDDKKDNHDGGSNISVEKSGNYIIPGIDFGTATSLISIWRNNNCEIIPDEFGNKTIPSFVSYTNVSKYVGHEAKKQKDINVENVFYEVKRLLGREFNEKAVQDCLSLLSYKIIENDRGCVSIQSTVRNNKIFTPEEISASVMSKLKDMAEKYLKREVKDVVITVPANFTDSQRQATNDAAKIAGLNCVRMFHEPTAAALAYGMMDRTIKSNKSNKSNESIKQESNNDNHNDNNDVDKDDVGENGVGEDDVDDDKKGTLILVYDFGGGTLDVSLIDIYDGVFDVQGTSGITHFGGVDFDNRLINYCLAKFSRQHYGSSDKLKTTGISSISRVSLQKLRTQCESAKKLLSTNNTSIIAIENFHDNKDMFVKIDRTGFENLCRDLFLLCINPIDELLTECEKNETDIDEVILVGGMTRMPYVRELLMAKFRNSTGKSKVNCSINPDEAVSVGAAIQGYIIANRDDAFSDSVTLMDVTPLSLGVEVIGGVMDVLIERNTMIPCEKVKLYSTDTDNTDSVIVKIFEGERPMTIHNTKIGEFELDKIPLCQRGIPEIEICFSIDINGMVTVSAVEKEANEKKSIVVNTNKNGLKPQELQKLIDEAEQQGAIDELDRVKKYSYYEIEDLCSNIISNINNKNFKLTKKDITSMTDEVNDIMSWLKEKKYKDRELEEIRDVLDKMSRKYGVLILSGKLEENGVKGNSDHVEATFIYSKEDDEEEDEMRQAFEKVQTDELGTEGMSDIDVTEIKDMRNALMDLCRTIGGIVSSGKMNVSNEHKQEILHYVDDVMMWYYSHDKPTKIDYKEKIDYINSICDEIVDNYEKDGKDLFVQTSLGTESDSNSRKLENMCLTLLAMINNKQLVGPRASFVLLTSKLKYALKFVYLRTEDTKNTKNVNDTHNTNNDTIDVDNDGNFDSDKTNKKDKLNKNDIISMTEDDFQKKCGEYINEINTYCDKIHNETQGISMNQGPVISFNKPKLTLVTDQFQIHDNDKYQKSSTNDPNTDVRKKGMSIMELMRNKQNEEINEMIENDIDDNNINNINANVNVNESYTKPDMSVDVKPDMCVDVKPDMCVDVKPDMSVDVKPDMSVDTKADMSVINDSSLNTTDVDVSPQ
jgi:heat shock 70kDa protein 1/2/6/8